MKRGAHGVDICAHVYASNIAPILAEVLPLHPIGAIIALLELQLLLHVGVLVPLRAVVGPRPCPLTSAPWVPHLHKAEVVVGLPIFPHGADLEQREGMLLHQALRLASCLDAAAAQHGTVTVVVPQQLKQLAGVMAFIRRLEAASSLVAGVVQDDEVSALPSIATGDLVAPRVAARHADDAPLGDTRLDGCIAAAQLGEGLLQKHGPNLFAMWASVLRLGMPIMSAAHTVNGTWVPLTRDVVVHDDCLPLAFLRIEKPDVVLTSRIHLRRQKKGVDRTFVLR
mmetsp:Transcript_144970/g.377216  ORF Transcript_144970/g.377216 Transcript_144970/m.377216 type:complete len:282 (+) Transcript_144970:158-1003(+)